MGEGSAQQEYGLDNYLQVFVLQIVMPLTIMLTGKSGIGVIVNSLEVSYDKPVV